VRRLDATDQLGMVQRVNTGPLLGPLAFDVIVWACSRWRELGEVRERHVPFTLEAMASDLGWRKGGGAAAELARALDTLRSATFRARVYNARLKETRIDTFGLIDRWERGEPDRSGRPARAGFLGDWLHEQLARRYVTFVNWAELRTLSSGTARLLVYLEAERFHGPTWRRTIGDTLLTTLGLVAAKPFHQRATLRRAAEDVARADNRYVSVSVEPGDHRVSTCSPRAAVIGSRTRRDRGSPGDGAGPPRLPARATKIGRSAKRCRHPPPPTAAGAAIVRGRASVRPGQVARWDRGSRHDVSCRNLVQYWASSVTPLDRREPSISAVADTVRLASDRACVETNPARKGLWAERRGAVRAVVDASGRCGALLQTNDLKEHRGLHGTISREGPWTGEGL
jgi:hypothetical protein